MSSLRLALRLVRSLAVTAGWLAALLLGYLVALPFPDRVQRRRRWRVRMLTSWARSMCRALGVEVEVVGRPPAQASFLVCNHLGYLDIPVLASVLPTVFVSKSEVARWPVIGWLATTAGTIYVQRERKRSLPEVNSSISAALERGDGVVVFPEGTSTGGHEVLPFRAPLLAPAADLGLAVHYASLSYATDPADPPASEAVCWWRDMEFAPHVLGLMRLRGVQARVVFGSEPVQGPNRKELAETLWQGVSVGITRQA